MSSGSSEVMRFQTSEPSGSPGRIADPDFRLAKAPSDVSSLRFASREFESKPWQLKQWSDRRGRIWLLKPMGPPVAVAKRVGMKRYFNIELKSRGEAAFPNLRGLTNLLRWPLFYGKEVMCLS